MKLPKVKNSHFFQKTKPEKPRDLKYRQFNQFFILSSLIPLILVGALNVLIDPYNFFNSPRIPGINEIRLSKLDNMRLFKTADVIRIKPVTIFLGTSRTEIGLVSDHPGLKDLQPAYNLGLSFASNYEALRYLEHAIANQPDLKLVVLGIDIFMFLDLNTTKPDFKENRLEKTHLILEDIVNATFSLTVFEKSLETIETNWNDRDLYELKNNRIFKRDRKIAEEFKVVIKDYTIAYLNIDKVSYAQHTKYDDFLKIIELCKKHNIDLKIFISPAHASELEILYQTDQWETIENWKRKLGEISSFPVWDFYTYNSVTTEPISNDMENYEDSSHYSQKVGNLILNKLLNYQVETVPKDFGVIINSNNIEEHLRQIREQRPLWSQKNPEVVQYIQKIVQEYKKSAK